MPQEKEPMTDRRLDPTLYDAYTPAQIAKRVERMSIQVAHAWPEGDLLLTAPTEELQELVLLFADDPAAFPAGDTDALVIELEPTVL